jgi:hypothetical protein
VVFTLKLRIFCAFLLFAVLSQALIGPVFSQTRPIQKPRVVRAEQYPGADIGAKVNAADKALGGRHG